MSWRRWGALVVVAIVIGAAIVSRSRLDLRWDLEGLRGFVEGLGVWGPVAFVGVVTFRSVLLVPSQLALIAGGVCFGTWLGTLYGALGLAASGVLIFEITRWLGADAVRSRVPAALQRALAAAGTRWGALLVVAGNGYPVGTVTGYHAAAALTPMPLPVFTLAVALGSLVRAWIYAYFGNAILERSSGELLAIAAAVALATAVLPLAHPRVREYMREWWRARRGSSS